MGEITKADGDLVCRLALEAVGLIDRWGERGLTMVSTHQIEAMALVIPAMAQRIADLEAQIAGQTDAVAGQANDHQPTEADDAQT